MAHCSGLFFFFFFFLFFCFFPFLFSLPESSSLKEKVLEVIRTRKFQSTKIFCFSNNGRRKYEYNTTFLFVSIHNKLFSSFQVNKAKLLIDSLSWFHVYHACCLNIVLVEIKIVVFIVLVYTSTTVQWVWPILTNLQLSFMSPII